MDNKKINLYEQLLEDYINTINNLLDFTESINVLPFKAKMFLPIIKSQIINDKFGTLIQGYEYILTNKLTILNFNINELDIMDEFNDLESVKSHNTTDIDSNELLDILIKIKENSKRLSNEHIIIIKKYFEFIIYILEEINELSNI